MPCRSSKEQEDWASTCSSNKQAIKQLHLNSCHVRERLQCYLTTASSSWPFANYYGSVCNSRHVRAHECVGAILFLKSCLTGCGMHEHLLLHSVKSIMVCGIPSGCGSTGEQASTLHIPPFQDVAWHSSLQLQASISVPQQQKQGLARSQRAKTDRSWPSRPA